MWLQSGSFLEEGMTPMNHPTGGFHQRDPWVPSLIPSSAPAAVRARRRLGLRLARRRSRSPRRRPRRRRRRPPGRWNRGESNEPPTNMEVQKGQLTKRKVVFLQGSAHFHVSWWEGKPPSWCCMDFPKARTGPCFRHVHLPGKPEQT